MNENRCWLSRITPRTGIDLKELARLGSLDPYSQHQALCRLFDLPPKAECSEKSTPFLFRAERIEPASAVGYAHPDLAGLPVFYVLSKKKGRKTVRVYGASKLVNTARPCAKGIDLPLNYAPIP